ncbi:transmembrane protein, putative [Medicago truncatula]|uniref:Transmembrane protein, putative n=1 Tax=Medicago truncatula TaxID=3880 RepID=A0A072V8T8_MEDTR|nr:transmembrane protein, putative [Medicago truncatula]
MQLQMNPQGKINHISPSPHYFLNKLTLLVIICFLRIFVNNFSFSFLWLGIDSTISDAPKFDILPNMKIAKYMNRNRKRLGQARLCTT